MSERSFPNDFSAASPRQDFNNTHSLHVSDAQAFLGNFQNCHIETGHLNGVPKRPSTIPRQVNRLYTGREDIGKAIEQALQPGNDEAPKCQRCFVISGIGGTGKSEVCLKFVEDHRNKYWGAFWIDLGSRGSATQSFQSIGRICGVGDAEIASVKNYLSSISQRWIMIIDNADDPTIDYSEYFPSGKNGSIIITTRDKELSDTYATVGSCELEQLPGELAQELLLCAAGIPAKEWCAKNKVATEIAMQLGNHTLALILAGAFIKHAGSLDRYLELYSKSKDRLWKFRLLQGRPQYGTLFSTFEVAAERLERLREEGMTDAEDALDLLHVLAFFHHEGQIEFIFKRAASCPSVFDPKDWGDFPELIRKRTQHLPEYLPLEDDNGEGSLRWRPACRLLEKSGLISRQELGQASIFTLHSLVHTWTRERQDINAQVLSWLKASSILARACLGDEAYAPAYDILRGHVRICLDYGYESCRERLSGATILPVLLQIAHVQSCSQELDKKSMHWIRQITEEAIQRKVLDKHDIGALQSQILQGFWLFDQGKTAESITRLEHVVRIRQRTLPEDHSDRLASEFSLGSIYRRNRRDQEAIDLLEHVSSVHERMFGKDHPRWLWSQCELGMAYGAVGRCHESVQTLNEVVSIQEGTLAYNDTELLISQESLADGLRKTGQEEAATELWKRVASAREENMAERHPDLHSQYDLAVAYRAAGRTTEALQLFQHVSRMEDAIGNEQERYWQTSTTKRALASIYLDVGQTNNAIELLEFLKGVEEKSLSAENSQYLRTLCGLANAYLKAGRRTEDAIGMLRRVLEVRNRTLNEQHPDLLYAKEVLATAYLHIQHRTSDAVRLLQEVVKVEEAKMDRESLVLLALQHDLGRAYYVSEQFEDAIRLLEHVLEYRGRLLDSHHKDLLSTKLWLACAYRKTQQRTSDAVSLLQHVVKVEEAEMARESSWLLLSQHHLGKAYFFNGQFREALELFKHVVQVQQSLAEDQREGHRNSLDWLAYTYKQINQLEDAENVERMIHDLSDKENAGSQPN